MNTKRMVIIALLASCIATAHLYNFGSFIHETYPTLKNNQSTVINGKFSPNPQTKGPTQFKVSTTQFNSEPFVNVSRHTQDAFAGNNLFILRKENRTTAQADHTLMVVDMNGTLLRQKELGQFHSLDYLNVEFINSSSIIYGDTSAGFRFTIWNLDTDRTQYIYYTGHHDIEPSYAGTFFTLNYYKRELAGENYMYDRIVEIDKKGQIIWNFDTYPLVDPNIPVFGDIYVGGNTTTKDVTHCNTVFYDAEEDVIYLNSRNANTFWKINHSSKEVIWGLGEYGNFTLYNKHDNVRDSLFYNAHSVEKIGPDTFILFDNDRHNKTDLNSQNSRILIIQVDEQNMTAQVVWDYIAPKKYYSRIWGDADILANGNKLGTFGTMEHPDTTMGARLVELNHDKDIVWELNFPRTENYKYGIYRMERFRKTPTLQLQSQSQAMNQLLTDENLSLDWDTYYNFRNKRNITGRYELYLNQTLIENKTHIFPQFWQTNTIQTTIPAAELHEGDYTLTMKLFDESNHSTTQNLYFTVAPYFITRQGASIIEKGQTQSELTWNGKTVSSLPYTLYLNSSIQQQGTWNGKTITLDLNDFPIGTYNITLFLSNASQFIYHDQFFVNIYPMNKPEIYNFPTSQTFNWNETVVLDWEIFDYQPERYQLELGNTLMLDKDWINQSEKVSWSVPTLNEGQFLVTFTAYDNNGLSNSHSFTLTVHPPENPVILPSDPTNIALKWGTEYIFSWEVHGASNYTVKRDNKILIANDTITNYTIQFPVKWQVDQWRLAQYQLTLIVSNPSGYTDESTHTIDLFLQQGDPYANKIIFSDSLGYSNGEYALGKPDGKAASLFSVYQNGYLTLDMGEQEEVIDNPGIDFKIYALNGSYRVHLAEDNLQSMVTIGNYQGEQEIDLAQTSLSLFRYIRIELLSDEVKLDAIEAYHYNKLDLASEVPIVYAPDDFTITTAISTISFIFEAYAFTPWNYTIYLNGRIYDNKPWTQNNIPISYKYTNLGLHYKQTYNFTILAVNLFGNSQSDMVIVTVKNVALYNSSNLIFLLSGTSILCISIVLAYLYKKRQYLI